MEKTQSRNLFSRSLMYAGAIVAYLVGSGFASGQECLQYFACFGFLPTVGGIIITGIFYAWFTAVLMEDGRKLKLKDTNKIFRYYCGKHIGMFFEVFTPIFLFLMLSIMISGAGSILNEYYGLHPQVGRIGMTILVFVTVILGLQGLVDIISKIGPLIIIFAVTVGVASIALNPNGLLEADAILETIEIKNYATPNWIISGFNFPAMGMLMMVPFLAGLGPSAKTRKEALAGGLAGGIAFTVCAGAMALGIVANIGILYDKAAPSLYVASSISPLVGTFFSVVLVAGIYTTSVPLLWLSGNRLVSNEKDKKFKPVVFVLVIIAFLIGQFPFEKLMNILYPLSGYFSWFVMICMLIKQIKTRKLIKETGNENAIVQVDNSVMGIKE